VRLTPSQAPYLARDQDEAIRALEEAPDGYRMLDYSGQCLEVLPSVAECFKNARVASIADNKFSSFPTPLTRLRLLQRLTISNNSIPEIPVEISRLVALRDLRAADNSIQQVSSKGIEKLVSLTFLDLQRNQLPELPSHLASCTSLTKLLVSKNRLRSLPASFTRLQRLRVLHADGNDMDRLGFHVQRLTEVGGGSPVRSSKIQKRNRRGI